MLSKRKSKVSKKRSSGGQKTREEKLGLIKKCELQHLDTMAKVDTMCEILRKKGMEPVYQYSPACKAFHIGVKPGGTAS